MESVFEEGFNDLGVANKLSQRASGVHETATRLLPHIIAWENELDELLQSFRDNDAQKHLSMLKVSVDPRILSDTSNAIIKVSHNDDLLLALKKSHVFHFGSEEDGRPSLSTQ